MGKELTLENNVEGRWRGHFGRQVNGDMVNKEGSEERRG